jgi:DNA-binding protein H-NS
MNLKKSYLESLSIEELTSLHERVGALLADRLAEEKRKLERQLSKLVAGSQITSPAHHVNQGKKMDRRPYPPVRPKYRNPTNHSETWAGRGKQPRWLVTQLKAGKKMQDFLIDSKSESRSSKRG